MTATEALERRIDELCRENERLRLRHEGYVVDLQEALAENARLRGQVASLIDRSFRTADKMDCLNTENAKLRELVRDLWLQLLNAYDYKEVDDFADRMRELGVGE